MYPNSQIAELGENATFYCEGSGRNVYWLIDNYLIASQLPNSYIKRGFVQQKERSGNRIRLNLTILASVRNNNTKVWCTVTADTTEIEIGAPLANLTVIGKKKNIAKYTLIKIIDPDCVVTICL